MVLINLMINEFIIHHFVKILNSGQSYRCEYVASSSTPTYALGQLKLLVLGLGPHQRRIRDIQRTPIFYSVGGPLSSFSFECKF